MRCFFVQSVVLGFSYTLQEFHVQVQIEVWLDSRQLCCKGAFLTSGYQFTTMS